MAPYPCNSPFKWRPLSANGSSPCKWFPLSPLPANSSLSLHCAPHIAPSFSMVPSPSSSCKFLPLPTVRTAYCALFLQMVPFFANGSISLHFLQMGPSPYSAYCIWRPLSASGSLLCKWFPVIPENCSLSLQNAWLHLSANSSLSTHFLLLAPSPYSTHCKWLPLLQVWFLSLQMVPSPFSSCKRLPLLLMVPILANGSLSLFFMQMAHSPYSAHCLAPSFCKWFPLPPLPANGSLSLQLKANGSLFFVAGSFSLQMFPSPFKYFSSICNWFLSLYKLFFLSW
jgi:hypothetical protein